MITVGILDDHLMLAEATAFVLDTCPDIEVVGTAVDARGAIDVVGRHRPDVLIVDTGPGDQDGVEIATSAAALCPATRVLVISARPDTDSVERAFAHGVQGYMTKTCSLDELVAAVRALAVGVAVLSPEILVTVTRRGAVAPASAMPIGCSLSARELETLTLVGQGLTNREIALRLFVSEATVKSHVAALMRKSGTSNRTQLALLQF